MKATIKRVNEALETELGGNIELVKGEGYFFFSGTTDDLGTASEWFTSSVYVFKVEELTITQWVDEAIDLSERI